LSEIFIPDHLSRLWRKPAERAFQPTLGLGLSGGAWQLPIETRLEVPPLAQMRLVVNLAPLSNHLFWGDGHQRRSGASSIGAIRIAPANEYGRAEVKGKSFAFAQIYLPLAAFDSMLQHSSRNVGDTIFKDPQFNQTDDLAAALTRNLLAAPNTPLEALYRDQLAMTLLLHLLQRYSYRPMLTTTGGLSANKARLARELLEQAIPNGISLHDLSIAANMSVFHFSRCFRLTFGTPPHAYLKALRLERAKELLANHSLPVTDIALNCGYATPSAFSSAFHKETGFTPSHYRKNITR
jgi:AraC-like DNA-binding protein